MSEGPIVIYPWNSPTLCKWDIIGMNHYYIKGHKYLFVAMKKGPECIKAEGDMASAVFASLERQAESKCP